MRFEDFLVLEEMSFEEFQDGRHGGHLGYRNGTTLAILNLHVTTMLPLGYRNGTILAILNLYVTLMPPINCQLNPTTCLGGDFGEVDVTNSDTNDIIHLTVPPQPPPHSMRQTLILMTSYTSQHFLSSSLLPAFLISILGK